MEMDRQTILDLYTPKICGNCVHFRKSNTGPGLCTLNEEELIRAWAKSEEIEAPRTNRDAKACASFSNLEVPQILGGRLDVLSNATMVSSGVSTCSNRDARTDIDFSTATWIVPTGDYVVVGGGDS